MKRIVIFLLFILFSAVVASASPASVKIGNATITVGEHVNIPLTIDADEEISCATIVITYDGDIVRVVSVSGSDFDQLVCNNTLGTTKIVAFQTGEGGLKEGIVANLYIEAKNEGYSPLNLEIETLKNNEGKKVPATALNGFISVSSPTASPTPSASPTSTSSPSDTTPTPSPSPTSPSPTPTPLSPAPTSTPFPSPTTSPATTPALSPSPALTPAFSSTTPSPSPSPPSLSPPLESREIIIQIENVMIEEGEYAEVPILITGDDVKYANLTLFVPPIVEVEEVYAGDYENFSYNISNGRIEMVAYTNKHLKGTVKLAEIKMKAIGKAHTAGELRLEVNEIRNGTQITIRNGQILIKERKKEELTLFILIAIMIMAIIIILLMMLWRKKSIKKGEK
ncbi:MAG: cohesin domain-containing protein [Candidatus Methanospirare jalkutatii]|nr:cohesin domain-containing protein [Candidatus Methanospirare jalkutatii]